MHTLKTVLRTIQHAHSCAIHEMYDYDRSKLVIYLSIDDIVDIRPEGKENQYC